MRDMKKTNVYVENLRTISCSQLTQSAYLCIPFNMKKSSTSLERYSYVDALRGWKRKNAMESWTAIPALFMLMEKSLMI